jgi:hypothetical protein
LTCTDRPDQLGYIGFEEFMNGHSREVMDGGESMRIFARAGYPVFGERSRNTYDVTIQFLYGGLSLRVSFLYNY